MDDEFLEKEFCMKLLRMGSQHPDIRDSLRDVLKKIRGAKDERDEEKQEMDEYNSYNTDTTGPT
jgi:hypothetical protein